MIILRGQHLPHAALILQLLPVFCLISITGAGLMGQESSGPISTIESVAAPDTPQTALSATQQKKLQDASVAPIALNGYCPVSILDQRAWIKGKEEFAVLLDGKMYHFQGAEQKAKFLKQTVKYAPALGGDCIVCAVDSHTRHPGTVHDTAIYNERLYLFANSVEKNKFVTEKDKYANGDLIAEGACIVSKMDLGEEVKGKPEFGTIYGGMRFLFADQQKKLSFLRNPAKYLRPETNDQN
ncbi:MAG: hypothetical protein KDB22_13485 [Planctomycetales bacterium]|nr:hypothetical protein [Planctomycetales bacterium]